MSRSPKPIIGVTTVHGNPRPGVYTLSDTFVAMVEAQGGIPLLLPNLPRTDVPRVAGMLDGLVLSAGPDIPPQCYGEKATDEINLASLSQIETDLGLIKAMLKRQKPMLGICLGHQLLNVAFGGTMIQDIPAERPHSIRHNHGYRNGTHGPFIGTSHLIYLTPESILAQSCQVEKFRAMSYHHQAVDTVGKGVTVVGKASDGIIEATEFPTPQLVFSVQWHPEVELDSLYSQAIFRLHVEAARIGMGTDAAPTMAPQASRTPTPRRKSVFGA